MYQICSVCMRQRKETKHKILWRHLNQHWKWMKNNSICVKFGVDLNFSSEGCLIHSAGPQTLSLNSGFTRTAMPLTSATGSCCACPSVLSCWCWHGYGYTGSSLAQSECQHTICSVNHQLSVFLFQLTCCLVLNQFLPLFISLHMISFILRGFSLFASCPLIHYYYHSFPFPFV